ncbi:MAG: hypothetical protein AVDCRST_MAG32-335, partial [uncultured Nocardioides sp.]
EEGPAPPARRLPGLLARAGPEQLRRGPPGHGRLALADRALALRVGHRRARLARSL